MSSDWPDVALEDVVGAVNTGLDAIKRAPIVERVTGIKCLRIQDVSQSKNFLDWGNTEVRESDFEKYRLRKNEIIMARTCSPGICLLIKSDMQAVFNNGLARIRAREDRVDPSFLLYIFKSQGFTDYIYGISHGTSVQLNMKVGDLTKYHLSLPPLHIQSQVANLLGTLDDRITLLRETNATLEAIAQAIFKSWFVDFDPVRVKQEGRAPEGMDEATAALFPDSFEESALGLVPRGWRYSSVGESFILTMGQSPPGDTYNENGNGLAFYQGRTDFGFRFPSQRVFCTAPTRLAEAGDTLVSVRAPVGDVNMALEKCCLGRGVAGVRHPNGYRSFVFYAVRGLRSRFDLFDSEGTVFGSINKKDFQTLPVIQPSIDVLASFDEIVSSIDQRVIENEEQIRTLATLRDTLLPRLISGQLRLPEAEALIEDATA